MSGVDFIAPHPPYKQVEGAILLLIQHVGKGEVSLFSYNARVTEAGNASKLLLIHRHDDKG
jgi:hypothetical protein